jgi:hypothetical protein
MFLGQKPSQPTAVGKILEWLPSGTHKGSPVIGQRVARPLRGPGPVVTTVIFHGSAEAGREWRRT